MTPPLWEKSWRADPAVRPLADRHYNRQKIGATQFAPPGRALVLRRPDAFWITSWPYARYVKHQWAGAWVCSAFRDESAHPKDVLPSELIRAAIAATRWYYGRPPLLGMITFVDEKKVRRKRDPGRCFIRAGFRRVGRAKDDRDKIAFQIWPWEMPSASPALGMSERHRDALNEFAREEHLS